MDNDDSMKLHENLVPVPFIAQLLDYHESVRRYGKRPLNARYTERQRDGDVVRRGKLDPSKRKPKHPTGIKGKNSRVIGGSGLPATVLSLMRRTRGDMLLRDIHDLLGAAYNRKRISDALSDLVRGGLLVATLEDGRKYRYRAA